MQGDWIDPLLLRVYSYILVHESAVLNLESTQQGEEEEEAAPPRQEDNEKDKSSVYSI